jgi:hypothetical protein
VAAAGAVHRQARLTGQRSGACAASSRASV